jgi:hypothetical protein
MRKPFPIIFEFIQFNFGKEFLTVLDRSPQRFEQAPLNGHRYLISLEAENGGSLFPVESRRPVAEKWRSSRHHTNQQAVVAGLSSQSGNLKWPV